MKKICLLFLVLSFTILSNAQNLPSSIDDLKQFIGLTEKEARTVAADIGYATYLKKDDKKDGPFVSKFYEEDEDYETLELIFHKGKVVGAKATTFTDEDYVKILSYLKRNGFKKTVNARGNTILNDVWENENANIDVRVEYFSINVESPRSITVASGMTWGF